MAEFNGAFNDIGLVDFEVYTSKKTFRARELGPADVVIEARPGNDGNVFEVQEGSTGQALFSKSYKVKNWSVTVRILRNSLGYAKLTYFIQEVLNGNVNLCGLKIKNKNFGKGADDTELNEVLEASTAVIQNFQGLEFGAGASGDFEVTFKTSGATYTSGVYSNWAEDYVEGEMPDRGGNVYPATGA